MYGSLKEPLPTIPKGGVQYPKDKPLWQIGSLSDGSEPRYLTTEEHLALVRRHNVGDHDTFPWRTALLFAVILASYSIAMRGSLDTARQIDVVGIKVGGVSRMTSRFANSVRGSIRASAFRGEKGWNEGMQHLLDQSDKTLAAVTDFTNKVEALKDSMKKDASNSAGGVIDQTLKAYRDAVQNLITQGIGQTSIGMNYLVPAICFELDAALKVIAAVDDTLSPLRPNAEQIVNWGGPDLVGTVDGVAQIRRWLRAVDAATPETLRTLHQQIEQVDSQLSWFYDLGNLDGKAFVDKVLSDTFDDRTKSIKEMSQGFAVAVHSAMKSGSALASSITLTALRDTIDGGDQQLAMLQESAAKLGSDGQQAFSEIAKVYRVVVIALFALAALSAGTSLGYAMYVEYVWENDEVARVWGRPVSKRPYMKLFWGCFSSFMGAGGTCCFWAFVVILDVVAALMVLVMFGVSLAGLTLNTIENGCGSRWVLSDDQFCTQVLEGVGEVLGFPILSQDGSKLSTCSDDDVLICSGHSSDYVRMTVCAALLGMVASWCIPRVMILVRAKAKRSVAAAIAVAKHGKNPVKLTAMVDSSGP
jgi:hypothetical protein